MSGFSTTGNGKGNRPRQLLCSGTRFSSRSALLNRRRGNYHSISSISMIEEPPSYYEALENSHCSAVSTSPRLTGFW